MNAHETGIVRGLQAAPRLANLGGLGVVALGIKRPPGGVPKNHAPKKKPHSTAGLRTKGNPNTRYKSHSAIFVSA